MSNVGDHRRASEHFSLQDVLMVIFCERIPVERRAKYSEGEEQSASSPSAGSKFHPFANFSDASNAVHADNYHVLSGR